MRRHVGIKLFTKIIWNNLIVSNHNENILTYFIQWSTLLQWFKTMIFLFSVFLAVTEIEVNYWTLAFSSHPRKMRKVLSLWNTRHCWKPDKRLRSETVAGLVFPAYCQRNKPGYCGIFFRRIVLCGIIRGALPQKECKVYFPMNINYDWPIEL
jgi:hypothetical protein